MTAFKAIDPAGPGVVELRRYTLHPGRRDEFIELFESELIHTQEAVGITVIGQFRDVEHPDTFTWLRGFRDMDDRRRALTAFYGGPVWAQHRDAANATMIDSDDVLLLAPAGDPRARSSGGGRPVRIVVRHLDASAAGVSIAPIDVPSWSTVLLLETLDSVNTFPALPVRSGEHVLVAVLQASLDGAPEPDWPPVACTHRVDVFRLDPTAHSSMW